MTGPARPPRVLDRLGGHIWAEHPDHPGQAYCTCCDTYADLAPNHHPYRRLRHADGYIQKIDAGVADLVQALWNIGVDTFGCCQGGCHPDFMYDGVDAQIILANEADRATAWTILSSLPGARWDEPRPGVDRPSLRFAAPYACPEYEREAATVEWNRTQAAAGKADASG